MTFFWTLVSKFWLLLLSLRYHIQVKGLDKLKDLPEKKGILFLPNHPAHMDPLFLLLHLWPKYRMRPLVVEYIFRLPLLKPFVKLVKALSIPNFDTSVNQLKIKKAEETIRTIADALKNGGNILLYPAGRLKSSGREALGGASGTHALLQECPEAQIVLVRTTGLWGSSFSRAILGRSPDLPNTLWQGIKTILKNGIFFAPRRKILIEIETNPQDFPRGGSRIDCNRYLESWYNRYLDPNGNFCDVEPIKLVSYAFWKQELLQPFQPKKKEGKNEGIAVSEETRTKIYNEFRRILENPGIEITPEKNLSFDLGMDSLNIADMIVFLAREYDVEEIHPEDIETVQDVLDVAEGARGSERPKATGLAHWPEEKNRPLPALPHGKTIPEAFLNSCQRMDGFAACGDDLVGVLSYKKMKRAVLVLAAHFQKMPDQTVAVLLPASAGAYLVILALQMAGKVPVMLNWTLGPRYLDEMMALSGANFVISSWRFLDRLAHVDFGNLIDKVKLLEDIRKELKLSEKLKGAFLSSFASIPCILRAFHLDRVDEESPAVVLFTSGTEASPKGVPLSHKNIISNQRSAMQCVDFKNTDTIYGILPPFHSFGFSVAGIFTILAGIRVAFYPDPTDSFALAEGIERWKITLFCSAPSFMKGLFHAVKRDEQLKTVQIFVVGAEKSPPELYERVEKLGTGAKLVEGYGITECSPILTLQRFNLPPRGVGNPIPGVELVTIHPETQELLPPGKEGEICVRGPNIFNGYLGNPRSPFIEIEGKQWYRTGDLGYLDETGALILSGRLKRFTKVGGEMISLGAVEDILLKELLKRGQANTETPSIAICADERSNDKSQLILFTTLSIEKDDANEILKNSGFSRLVKISIVKKIGEIPLMGTGKTDYRKLQSFLE